MKAIIPFYFAMEIRGSAKHLSGDKDYSPRREGSEPVLIGLDDSSLVVDRLCDQMRGNTAVTYFYFDFTAYEEQSVTHVLGSLLKQMIRGTGRIPEEIWRAFREQNEAVGERRPQLGDIVRMLQLVASSQPTFMCIDALDECAPRHLVRLLNSLKKILEKSPDTRILVLGRPYIRAEVDEYLTGRVTIVSLSPGRDDVVRFLRARLYEETPDAMDESLEAEILEQISENMSEMCVAAMVLRILSYVTD